MGRRGAWTAVAALLASAAPCPAQDPAPGKPAAVPVAEVSADGTKPYRTILAALAAVDPGGRVVVGPGRYEENLLLRKPVTLEGKGTAREVTIAATSGNCVTVIAPDVVLRNLSIARNGDGTGAAALFVESGTVSVVACDLSCDAGDGVALQGDGVAALLKKCRIHHVAQCGVQVRGKGAVTLEECEVSESIQWGIFATDEKTNATLRRCKLVKCGWAAARVYDGATMLLEGCQVLESGEIGIQCKGATVKVVDGMLQGGKKSGVYVYEQGSATLEKTEIRDFALHGLECTGKGKAALKGCRVKDCREIGVWFHGGASGSMEGGGISYCGLNGVQVDDGCDPLFREVSIENNSGDGVVVFETAKGRFEKCRVVGNEESGIHVVSNGEPTVRGCKILGNLHYGVSCEKGSRGVVEMCEFAGNTRGAIEIVPGSGIVKRNNVEKK